MRFDQRIEVNRTVAEVWEFLWDIERLARCLPSCKEVREVEAQQRYAVVMEERVGPFKARFEMTVTVAERIAERLRGMTSAKQACYDLLQDALNDGGSDNITIIVGRDVKKD